MDEQLLPEVPEYPIITPESHDRFPLLFAESQPCNIPLEHGDDLAIQEMCEILTGLEGEAAGLAAVQVGYPKRIFVLQRNNRLQIFVNPTVVSQSRETTSKREGCLSLPNMTFRIARPRSITLEWFDEHGSHHTDTFTNFWARAICHEMDHLNGKILAEHEHSVLVKDKPRSYFKYQQGSIIRDVAFNNRVKKRRAKKKRAKQQRKHAGQKR